jgi:cyanate permease
MQEPRYAWVVVWAVFVALAVIFGVAYSFAAFFASFETEFGAHRADVAMVFGLSGLVYFVLGAGGVMLSDRFGPRVVCSAGMLCIAAGLLGASLARSMAAIYVAYGVGIGVGIALVYTTRHVHSRSKRRGWHVQMTRVCHLNGSPQGAYCARRPDPMRTG